VGGEHLDVTQITPFHLSILRVAGPIQSHVGREKPPDRAHQGDDTQPEKPDGDRLLGPDRLAGDAEIASGDMAENVAADAQGRQRGQE
jgi:hypothetical protein